MIYDSLKNIESYKEFKELYKVLTHIRDMEGTVPEKRVEIDEQSFINPVALITKDREECVFEAHKKYLDIHCVFEGIECIAVTDVSVLEEVKAFSEEEDFGLYRGQEDVNFVLEKGKFLVCFPDDAHKVGISNGQVASVKKVVGKIQVI